MMEGQDEDKELGVGAGGGRCYGAFCVCFQLGTSLLTRQ